MEKVRFGLFAHHASPRAYSGITSNFFPNLAGNSVDRSDVPLQGVPAFNGAPPPGVQYMTLPGYPHGFYPPLVPKPGDGHPAYPPPQYILASVPHPMQQLHGTSEGDNNMYPPQGFYQTAVLAPIPYHPQYAITRADGSPQYPAYPGPVYHKEGPTPGQGEMVNGVHDGTEGQQVDNGKGT
jgi:hypothetical protein